MIILTKKQQDKIISKFIALDDILDDYTEAKIKSMDHIVKLVSITTGIKGLVAMKNNSETKMHRELAKWYRDVIETDNEEKARKEVFAMHDELEATKNKLKVCEKALELACYEITASTCDTTEDLIEFYTQRAREEL